MTAEDLETILRKFRPGEREYARQKIVFAEVCGWSEFFLWHGEDDACAVDLMGVDPDGRRRAVPDMDKETA